MINLQKWIKTAPFLILRDPSRGLRGAQLRENATPVSQRTTNNIVIYEGTEDHPFKPKKSGMIEKTREL